MQIGTQGRYQLSGDPGEGRALSSAVLLRLEGQPGWAPQLGSKVDTLGRRGEGSVCFLPRVLTPRTPYGSPAAHPEV